MPRSTENGGASAEHRQARLLAREGGGSGVAQVVGMALRYGAAFFAVRALGASGYGAFALALTTMGIANVISLLGFSPGILPFLSRARSEGDDEQIRSLVRGSLAVVLVASILLGALVYAIAPWLAESIFEKPHLADFLRPLAALTVLGTLVGMISSLLQGFLAVKESAWIEHVLSIGVTAAGMALSWLAGFGMTGVVVSALAGPAMALLCGGVLLTRRVPVAFGSSTRSSPFPFARVVSYSWPLMGTSMLAFLLAWTDILLMGVFRGSDEVGIYGICARLAVAILLVHQSLGPIFLARLSDLYVKRDWDAIRHLYHLTARWCMWAGLVISAALIIWSEPILAVFGPEFVAGAPALVVLAVGKAVTASSGLCGRVFGVTGKGRLNLINMLLLVGGNGVLNVLWIPQHGGLGAAAATCVSLSCVKVVQVVEIWILYRLLPWSPKSLVPLIGLAALGAVAYPLRQGIGGDWGWLVSFTGFCVTSLALYRVGGFGDEDREVWRAVRARLESRGERAGMSSPKD